jgi:hypothetical protein
MRRYGGQAARPAAAGISRSGQPGVSSHAWLLAHGRYLAALRLAVVSAVSALVTLGSTTRRTTSYPPPRLWYPWVRQHDELGLLHSVSLRVTAADTPRSPRPEAIDRPGSKPGGLLRLQAQGLLRFQALGTVGRPRLRVADCPAACMGPPVLRRMSFQWNSVRIRPPSRTFASFSYKTVRNTRS